MDIDRELDFADYEEAEDQLKTAVKSGCESKDNPYRECATGMYYGGGWDNEAGFQIGGKGEVDDKFSFCPFCGKPVNI